MTDSEQLHSHRLNMIGRSLFSHFQQIIRNAEMFEDNNQVFIKLSKSLANAVRESYKILGGCTLRLSSYQAFLNDNRVFIDAGMMESVKFLNDLFKSADIGGIFYHEECVDPKILLKSVFAFRYAIIEDKARGDKSIKKSLLRRHCPYIEPLALNRFETPMTGIRDEENAKKLLMRNTSKLIMFIEDIETNIKQDQAFNVNILIRIVLNLIRVNQAYPHLVIALSQARLENELVSRLFHSVILILAFCKKLQLSRQTQMDLAVAGVFHFIGLQTIPASIRNTPKLQNYTDTLPHRAARKLMETRFVNRALYFRILLAFQTPFSRNPLYQNHSLLPASRLLRTLDLFVGLWKHPKGDPLLPSACLITLLKSDNPAVDKPFLIVLSEALGMFQPGCFGLLDESLPVVISKCSDEDKENNVLTLLCTAEGKGRKSDKINIDFSDEIQAETIYERLAFLDPSKPHPNPIHTYFPQGFISLGR